MSEEDKAKAFSDQLGIDLVQIQSHLQAKVQSNIQKSRKLGQKTLLQLADDDEPKSKIFGEKEEDSDDGEKSILELTKIAKGESQPQPAANKTSAVQTEKQEEKKEKSEEKKEEKAEDKKEQKEEKKEEMSEEADDKKEAVKVVIPDNKAAAKPAGKSDDNTNSIVVTGATHARELLSMQVPMYMALKMIHQGLFSKKEKYQQMLATTKFYFIPIINVDGAALVQETWNSDAKILNKRKNMNPSNNAKCGDENSGVDLNRNYGIDWVGLN